MLCFDKIRQFFLCLSEQRYLQDKWIGDRSLVEIMNRRFDLEMETKSKKKVVNRRMRALTGSCEKWYQDYKGFLAIRSNIANYNQRLSGYTTFYLISTSRQYLFKQIRNGSNKPIEIYKAIKNRCQCHYGAM